MQDLQFAARQLKPMIRASGFPGHNHGVHFAKNWNDSFHEAPQFKKGERGNVSNP